jgi:hypothetical protein
MAADIGIVRLHEYPLANGNPFQQYFGIFSQVVAFIYDCFHLLTVLFLVSHHL